MEVSITSLLIEAGSVGVFALLAIRAMRFLRERDIAQMEDNARRDELFTLTLREIGAECHSVQIKATEALERNTEAFGRNTEAFRTVADLMRSA